MGNTLSSMLLAINVTGACDEKAKRSNSVPLQPTAAPATSIPKDGYYNARGTVTKINLEFGSVELDREDIPGVMPPMLMEFYVKDKAELKPLKVGDRVDFVLEYKHPAETIVSINKAK